MATARKETPLIVIVGPTASGKSSLALDIAERYNGEIICADSRTVYRGMDIGTAKPGTSDQERIPHHLLDIVDPAQPFTAADFKTRALQAIGDITARGKLPIMVGGTGLYIDSVIFDYAFLPAASPVDREELQALNVEQLQQKLANEGIPLPENQRNPRHLIRALETNGAVPVRKGIRKNTLVIGLEVSKEELIRRIQSRTKAMLKAGLESEVNRLATKYGWAAPGLSAVGYKEWQFVADSDAAAEQIVNASVKYAKRQRTWFIRNPSIKWVKNSSEALDLVKSFLQP